MVAKGFKLVYSMIVSIPNFVIYIYSRPRAKQMDPTCKLGTTVRLSDA